MTNVDQRVFELSDRWLSETSPSPHIALSSRARYARNVAGFPFSPHARAEVLAEVDNYIREGIARSPELSGWERVQIGKLSPNDRRFLKESRLISKEMERGGDHLTAYFSPDGTSSILVNEEDHLRIQVLAPGLDVRSAVARLNEIDTALAAQVGYAWSPKLGYLTACPTNVGTGFRASVMLHLPGLTLLQEVEASLQGIAHHGLTVRGFYGENTEYTGDFYQVSNEITLGRTTDQIVATLMGVIERLIERENEARLDLFKHHVVATNDSIWRSYALLAYAQRMDSNEAMRLLSRIRLGIDRGYFRELDHNAFNRLVVEIQPAHLERRKGTGNEGLSRDEIRAKILRSKIRQAPDRN